MPRKYNPTVVMVDYGNPYEDRYPEPRMQECHDGEWVKLKTFEDTTAMLIAANRRMQEEIHQLRQQISESNSNSTQLNYE